MMNGIGNVTKPSIEINVPGERVPLVIGTGGTTIKNLQEKFNVRMYFVGQNQETYLQRALRISGTPDSIIAARTHIEKIIRGEIDETNSSLLSPQTTTTLTSTTTTTNIFPTFNSNNTNRLSSGADEHTEEINVPKNLYPQIFGNDNSRLLSIKMNSAIKSIDVLDGIKIGENNQEFCVVKLVGPFNNVMNAKSAIEISLQRLRQKVEPHLELNNSETTLSRHSSDITNNTNTFEFESVRAQLPRSRSQLKTTNLNGYSSDESSTTLIPLDGPNSARGRPNGGNSEQLSFQPNGIIKKTENIKKVENQVNLVIEKARKEILTLFNTHNNNNNNNNMSSSSESKNQSEEMQKLASEIIELKNQVKERDEIINDLKTQINSAKNMSNGSLNNSTESHRFNSNFSRFS